MPPRSNYTSQLHQLIDKLNIEGSTCVPAELCTAEECTRAWHNMYFTAWHWNHKDAQEGWILWYADKLTWDIFFKPREFPEPEPKRTLKQASSSQETSAQAQSEPAAQAIPTAQSGPSSSDESIPSQPVLPVVKMPKKKRVIPEGSWRRRSDEDETLFAQEKKALPADVRDPLKAVAETACSNAEVPKASPSIFAQNEQEASVPNEANTIETATMENSTIEDTTIETAKIRDPMVENSSNAEGPILDPLSQAVRTSFLMSSSTSAVDNGPTTPIVIVAQSPKNIQGDESTTPTDSYETSQSTPNDKTAQRELTATELVVPLPTIAQAESPNLWRILLQRLIMRLFRQHRETRHMEDQAQLNQLPSRPPLLSMLRILILQILRRSFNWLKKMFNPPHIQELKSTQFNPQSFTGGCNCTTKVFGLVLGIAFHY
ncbi:hypothetical protein GLAREA_06549 [Glarea lozoyensis ATCC 20868]|uniref:Uncharacterized protein n=1 Tax=Glarea lozoyensis (strain ATCC 20868 / MF5171) TaxID=1116229 RepID=S3DN65_GLAL2|nr:uncharacterized protein GLAREA_06549 [Glarea lozoyensis ATCC 20868]EPE33536.1 hypothetical protein GLAREA_06549 [Glarea lozoyensis ATCC 20868]